MMSQPDLSLSVLPVPFPVDLANPLDPFQSWLPMHWDRLSSFTSEHDGLDGPAINGSTCFVVDASPGVLGSGSAVEICYSRNKVVDECAENAALDDPDINGLDDLTIDKILELVKLEKGSRTIVDFHTVPDGLHVETKRETFYRGTCLLPSPPPLPSVLLSSLRATHYLPQSPHVMLVKIPLSQEVRVLKINLGGNDMPQDIEYMTGLPEVDFLVRPTHVVVDEAGFFNGLLSDHHPASALHVAIDRHRRRQGGIPWELKLAWSIDIAAAIAWMHARGLVWADLKTDNVLLCKDGHCRLIDYAPGGWTLHWCPPEAHEPGWEGTMAGDVFALGLVLWCVAVEVACIEREEADDSPRLFWKEDIPEWFQKLVHSCVVPQPAGRPSSRDVYNMLRAYGL
ncbi:kinase-like domain-containing protein [Mycena haematopus]|nr:kinase-like domain-containing protein [Mycena haematopus]